MFVFLAAFSCAAGAQRQDLDLSVSDNRIVTIDYTLYVDGNTVAETTRGKSPLIYVQGSGQLMESLEKNIEGMKKEQKKNIVLKPEEAFGNVRKDYFVEVSLDKIPEEYRTEGSELKVLGKDGKPIKCKVDKIKKEKAVLDFNHSLAGKTLRYKVEIKDVKDKMQFG